ncbi:MAG: error-prone DNA polymerase [Phycisphaerae bacterium]
MPEQPEKRYKPTVTPRRPAAAGATQYVELQTTSNFTFLHGASHPEEYIQRAAELEYDAIALTDHATMAGMVRAHTAAKQAGIRLIVGTYIHIDLPASDSNSRQHCNVLLYPTDVASYGRLCRLITLGRRQAGKGSYRITLENVLAHQAGLLVIALPPAHADAAFIDTLMILKSVVDDDRLSLAMIRRYGCNDAQTLQQLAQLSRRTELAPVAVNDVLYHAPRRQRLQDVLTCIRLGRTIHELGLQRIAHAERHLKSPAEMYRLFRDYPQALKRPLEIAARAKAFSMDQLTYHYPHEICPPGFTPMDYLIQLTLQGAAQRHPEGVPESLQRRLEHEFSLIRELNYPAYFLTVYDIVRFAVSQNILCQGRGAAANSAVCFCLGITAVDPQRIDLLMERFISKERNEPPDIDIDFEHERREEVIQYIYKRFGRNRAAITAEIISYRRKSALRDVGKAMGLSLDCVDKLAKSGDWWEKGMIREHQLRELGLNPSDTTITQVLELAGELIGFPRHLSQHVGGFVITEQPLCELVPIENAAMPDRSIIQWDKDDLDAMGILKIDILALGMLTCIRKAIDLVNRWNRRINPAPAAITFATIPPEAAEVYDMLCRADSIGVFQVESRAQMAMLPRLKPRCYYDLVIEVALVRPGPIQGGMVHPYLRRRSGREPVDYPSAAVRGVLERTLGVPLFQEQVMRLAMAAAGFTPGQADALRRSMAAWKRKGNQLAAFGGQLIAGMLANGYTQEFAQRCFEQIKGFGEYGFPESHAASFALLVYVSAWLKCFYPAAFAAGLLNSQPMGFYQPAQIIRDAQNHRVQVLPVDVNYSQWDCTLEPAAGDMSPASRRLYAGGPTLRLGLRMVKGLHQSGADLICDAVARHGRMESISTLRRLSRCSLADLKSLARADAFGSMGLDRQEALWHIRRLRSEALPLLDELNLMEPRACLPMIAESQKVISDYQSVGLSLKAHPMSFVRLILNQRGIVAASELADAARHPDASQLAVAGLVLVRQRPGTASGILFITMEDETGTVNLIVKPRIYQRYRMDLRHSTALVVWGQLQRQEGVIHIIARRAVNLQTITRSTETLQSVSRDFH